MGKAITPEKRAAKNERARQRRAAKVTEQVTETVVTDATIIDEVALPAVSEPVDLNIREVEAAIEANSKDAEKFVDDLINAQAAADSSEHAAIVAMVKEIRARNATVAAFAACFAERAALRGMKASVVKVRKSNLTGVLNEILGNEVFEAAFMADETLGLQAAYALRSEMKNPKAEQGSEGSEASADDSDDDVADDAPVTAYDALRKAIRAAIECADVAKRDDIAEDLREVLTKLMMSNGDIRQVESAPL